MQYDEFGDLIIALMETRLYQTEDHLVQETLRVPLRKTKPELQCAFGIFGENWES